MVRIKNYLSAKYDLTDEEWLLFSSLLVKKEYKAREEILRAGEVEHFLSFLELGSVRFYIPHEENDITFAFIFENEFVCAYDSFLTQESCAYNVETMLPTVLWQLTYDNLQFLYSRYKQSNVWGRIFTEEIYLKKAKREISFLTKSAEERYFDLFNERPELLRKVPLKFIASYIGVTPQALSRIRRRIT